MSSIQLKSKISQTQAINLYYDLELINNDTTGLNQPAILRFNEIRNNPYLMSPENYYMSVVRFSIQTPSLPIFIPQAQIGQSQQNRLIYSFTLTWKSVLVPTKTYEFQQNVVYIPSDLSQPLPLPPIDFQDITSAYYFVFAYQQWVAMLNNALSLCLNGLKNLVLAGGENLPSLNPPFLEFDPVAQVMILDCDLVGYSDSLINPIKLFANAPMYTLLASFQAISQGYGSSIINGKNFQFVITNINGTNILTLPTYSAIQMYQEQSSIALLNPISSLVFTTAQLPVIPEMVATPRVFNSDSNLFNTGNNANITPMMTDFIVPFEVGNTYRPNVVYTPSGEYRLIDLYGTSPLSAIEMSVFWKDQFGGLHPFYLNSGCSATIKLLFRRKDYNNINL